MAFFKTSLIRKLTLFLAAAMLSVSAMATDFNQLQRLANQGFAEAQYDLGEMYYFSEGVRQDYAKAKNWYQKAADQGVAEAQHNLGVLYYEGKSVRQDNDTAKEWVRKSCDNGYEDGCDAYRILNQ